MRKYRLYSEWRDIEAIGEDLGQALAKRGELRMPDKVSGGVVVEHGELLELKRVYAQGTAPFKRGNDTVERALAETVDGQIFEVVARLVEEYPEADRIYNVHRTPQIRQASVQPLEAHPDGLG